MLYVGRGELVELKEWCKSYVISRGSTNEIGKVKLLCVKSGTMCARRSVLAVVVCGGC